MSYRSTRKLSFAFLSLSIAGLVPCVAMAQPFECDDRFGACGTPETSGGGGGGGGGSILIANTDLGDTYQFADDFDNDGIEDPFDNCVRFYNPSQGDGDGDAFGDSCDNCLATPNGDQFDIDGDASGDSCDDDMDGDGIGNLTDNCGGIPNPMLKNGTSQPDLDGNGKGDACDTDIDGDGLKNLEDPCPLSASLTGSTAENRAKCFPDGDGDGISEVDPLRPDICPSAFDPDQLDNDEDGMGDNCDPDMDNDGLANNLDNCGLVGNADQIDADRDGRGDMCDPKYCYVVFGDEGNCLDPNDVLKVYAPALLAKTGKSFRLPAFVNRDDARFSYQWTVVSAPNGSSATVRHSRGEIAKLLNHEFVYTEAAAFQPDEEGTYQLKISVTAMDADPLSGEIGVTAQYLVNVEANGGGGNAGGCAVGGGSSPVAGWFLAMLACVPLLRRRRHAR